MEHALLDDPQQRARLQLPVIWNRHGDRPALRLLVAQDHVAALLPHEREAVAFQDRANLAPGEPPQPAHLRSDCHVERADLHARVHPLAHL